MNSTSSGNGARAAVAVRCRCGNRIVLEPRWIDKPTGCAECDDAFVVTMLISPKTGRRVPHVQYTKTISPTRVKSERQTLTWANVTCECGTKIGLQPKFLGKDLTCSRCGRIFVVRTPRALEGACSEENRPAPPAEMHVLCVCGEDLSVTSYFYNQDMYCAGCGVLIHLDLGFSRETGTYDLRCRLL